MKKILTGLALLLSAVSFSCEKEIDWLDHYVLAEQAVNRKDGNSAIEEFTRAIELNPEKIFLYLQRGQIYEKKHEWKNAIRDFTYVIENPNTHVSIILPALYSRARCYLHLDGIDNYLNDRTESTRFERDFKLAKSLDTSLVHTEENENYSIDLNIPESDINNPEYRKQYAKMMVQLGYCNSEKDVMFFDNWVAVTKLKKQKTYCQECTNKNPSLKKNIQSCVGCGHPLKLALGKNNNPTDETDCKWWCDRVSDSAEGLCIKTFKSG